jgi:hypothetical protein
MKRPWTLLILLILLLIALFPGTFDPYQVTGEESLAGQARGLVNWVQSAIRPQPRLAPDAVETTTDVPLFGINAFLQSEVLPEVREESLRRLQDAGIGMIRQEFPWEDIEIHGKGDFMDRRNLEAVGEISAWDKYDNIIELAEQYDIEVLARLGNPPAWSRAAGDTLGTQAPPDNYADFADFVRAVVSRYRGRITYYQIWNEPNIYPEWGEQIPDPIAFTDLLCRAYAAAKEADPLAVIVAPALGPTIALDARDKNDLYYLQRMYLAGAGECFDIFSAQGYGLFSGPTDHRLLPTVMNYPHHLYIRDLMVRHGDGDKPVWLSEMNWNAAAPELPADYGRVTEAQQAQYIVEAYQRAQREWPWVEAINVWFFKRAGESERNQSWYYFRLMEPDFSPLPAFESLAAYATSVAAEREEPLPAYWYTWVRVRPTVALLLAGLLLWGTLGYLAPPELARERSG